MIEHLGIIKVPVIHERKRRKVYGLA